MITKSTTMNIFDICREMKAEGFKYGSLENGSCLKELGRASGQLQSFHFKPAYGVYFSKITETYPEDREDDDHGLLATDWYNFVIDQDYNVPMYASRGLLFAKFDETRLTSNSDPRFKVGGDFRLKQEVQYFPALPRWNAVGAEYAGIRVDPYVNSAPDMFHSDPCVDSAADIFPAWDVDTVCIWDATVVTELRWFENAGTPWTYDVLSPA